MKLLTSTRSCCLGKRTHALPNPLALACLNPESNGRPLSIYADCFEPRSCFLNLKGNRFWMAPTA